ncbi:MAG: DUF1351 domain-containing protein [Clostridia bacterium]
MSTEKQELQIVLEQKVGFFTGNFEQVREELKVKVSEYADLVYSEDNFIMAKEDAAKLRKLSNMIDSKRIETKKAYMRPAEEFDNQCKELKRVVDDTIRPIAMQIEEFDTKRKTLKKDKIFEYFQTKSVGLEMYAVFMDVFDEKMLNVSYTIKQYKLDIDNYVTKIGTDVKTLGDTGSEFAWKALEDYKANKDLGRAFKTITLLEEQKREIIAKERAAAELIKAKEEEERRIKAEAERIAREMIEKEKLEAERQKVIEAERIKREQERLIEEAKQEQARLEREAIEKIERDRLLAEQKAQFEKDEAIRIEAERVEQAKQKEADRLAQIEFERMQKELEEERAEMDRIEAEKAEARRIEQEEVERIAKEVAEKIRIEKEANQTYTMFVLNLTKTELFELAEHLKLKGYSYKSTKDNN